jgi:hypothetical protein
MRLIRALDRKGGVKPKPLVHPTLSKPRELLAAATLLGNSVSYPLTSLLRVLLKSRVYQGRDQGREASSKQPFCDGAHTQCEFKSEVQAFELPAK